MEIRPFDPAEYLDSEEAIAAYLADARADGQDEAVQAARVAARARAMIKARQAAAPKSAGGHG